MNMQQEAGASRDVPIQEETQQKSSMVGQLRHMWEHGLSKSQTEKMKTARNAVVFGVASFFIVKFGDLLAI